MNMTEECHRRAEEADRAAENAETLEAKLFYREIAQHWREMAARPEQSLIPFGNSFLGTDLF